MAQVTSLAAQLFSDIDKKKAVEFFNKYMDVMFPEVERKEVDAKAMMKELQAFSSKEVKLVPTKGGFSLKIDDKKKG